LISKPARISSRRERELKLPVCYCPLSRIGSIKVKVNAIAALLVVVIICTSQPLAQGAKNPATNYPALVSASKIKGTHVKNLQNQDLGEIEEVLIEPDGGQVRFLVLEVGGFWGLGATKVAVPWTAFQLSQEGNNPKWGLLTVTKRN
jgi:sporulation protein YlmC with PRC-barrel domain